MIGHILDNRYKILEKVGTGGMASVYKAQDILLDRIVAVKILHSKYGNDHDFVVRFRQEAQAAAKEKDGLAEAKVMEEKLGAQARGEEQLGAAKAKATKPDLILMDVVMPGLNGYQATRTLTRDDETKTIPIIVCTSKGQETDRIWGLRQGAIDYLVKPLNPEELLQRIAALP